MKPAEASSQFERSSAIVICSPSSPGMAKGRFRLPNTPLYARLAREGRLLAGAETGDGFAFSNVVTRLPMESMVEGYIRVMETLYDPEVYFERCREHLR